MSLRRMALCAPSRVLPWVLLLLSSCSNVVGPGREAVDDRTGLWIGQTGVILNVAETTQLTARVREAAHSSMQPVQNGRWWTENASVLRVFGQGNVEALAPGRATVWVEAGGRRDSATVLVRGPGEAPSLRWRSVAVGWDHACALSQQGRVYCWGGNPFGELGSGARRMFTTAVAPVAVAGGRVFAEVHVGERHTCALEPDGTPWCWGLLANTGAGEWSETQYARAVPERVRFPGRFSRLSVGFNHSCGLDPQGLAYCWGNNFSGQLGIGTRDDGRLQPTRVATALRFSEISIRSLTSCGLTTEGAAYCWGTNQPPVVGHDAQRLWYELPEPVSGGHRFIELAASGVLCGRDVEKRTWCWGAGADLPGLRRDPANPHAPARLVDDPGFERIFTGHNLMCGLLADGSAHCFGSNLFSRLGTDRTLSEVHGEYGGTPIPYSSRLVPIAGGHSWKQLSLGQSASCGVTVEGELYCWGSNRVGLLGAGRVTGHYHLEPVPSLAGHSPVPVRVADPL
jgi:alpha-tubulin suppressor-like RCC1 family protein